MEANVPKIVDTTADMKATITVVYNADISWESSNKALYHFNEKPSHTPVERAELNEKIIKTTIGTYVKMKITVK